LVTRLGLYLRPFPHWGKGFFLKKEASIAGSFTALSFEFLSYSCGYLLAQIRRTEAAIACGNTPPLSRVVALNYIQTHS